MNSNDGRFHGRRGDSCLSILEYESIVSVKMRKCKSRKLENLWVSFIMYCNRNLDKKFVLVVKDKRDSCCELRICEKRN